MIEIINRTILWGGEVDEKLALELVKELKVLDSDPSDVIIECIGSEGGYYDTAACAIIDTILNMRSHVTTVANGLGI